MKQWFLICTSTYNYSESVLNALDKTEILKKNPFGQNKRELQLISFTLNLRFLYELLIFLYLSFAPRPLIFKLQREVLKFYDICVPKN